MEKHSHGFNDGQPCGLHITAGGLFVTRNARVRKVAKVPRTQDGASRVQIRVCAFAVGPLRKHLCVLGKKAMVGET